MLSFKELHRHASSLAGRETCMTETCMTKLHDQAAWRTKVKGDKKI